MLETILGAVLPMVVTLLLGFVATRRRDFGPEDVSILNRMVLGYAVPLALFAGTVATSRAELTQVVPLVIALCVAIVGLYVAVFLSSRIAFHLRISTSALAALTASAPAVPFMGPAVLGDLFGGSSAIPIAIASLVINLAVLPVTILLLTLDIAERGSQRASLTAREGEHSASSPASRLSEFAATLAETVKRPIVWAPVLAFIIVLSGFHIPQLIVNSLLMLGHASGGVALFAAGCVLASAKIKLNTYVLSVVLLKIIVQPALVLGGLRWLHYGIPIVSEAALTTAIPAMPIVMMLALQYRVAEAESVSAVSLSMIGSVITLGAFAALTI
jgi:malonate transporter and related proteins